MLPSDRKHEIAKKLFGFNHSILGVGDGPLKMATATGDAILRDLILETQKAIKELGPGMMVFNHQERMAKFSTIADLKELIAAARKDGLNGFADTLLKAIDLIESSDPTRLLIIGVASSNTFAINKLQLDRAQENLAQVLESFR